MKLKRLGKGLAKSMRGVEQKDDSEDDAEGEQVNGGKQATLSVNAWVHVKV